MLVVSLEPTLQSWLLLEASLTRWLAAVLSQSLVPLGFLLLALQDIREAVALSSSCAAAGQS